MDMNTLADLGARRDDAQEMGRVQRLERLPEQGKQDARTRVDLLLDSGLFVESGLLARNSQPKLHDLAPTDAQPAPCDSPESAQKLCDLVPDDHRRTYDMPRTVELLVDDVPCFASGPTYGKSLIPASARFDGDPVEAGNLCIGFVVRIDS